ncbi:MAG: RlmE family RNA methyltransferase [Candidatus Kariarchaeum pelagius]|jgi:23S rRNA (uridine2552-2'-O)-methyltransferase|nr:23S rRNA (uridine(2552)-2'-O)-methyltransferase [Candidatus Heimdallarchaeota archaeon]
MSYQRKDPFYKKAKDKGYRARSSFKLKQIQKKFSIMKRGDLVVDLGAAPGGWSQVASEFVGSNGTVVAVDRLPIREFQNENIIRLQLDMQSPKLLDFLSNDIKREVDVVLSDLAGNVSGNWDLDSDRQLYLASLALSTAKKFLKKEGNFVTKVFRGANLKEFEDEIKDEFEFIKHWRPPATRKTSAEEYIICKSFI